MPTYTPLESIVLTSSASSLTFSNISQNYQDLVIVGGAISSSDISYNLQFNGDTSSNYSTTYLLGSGSAASSGRLSNGTKIEANGRTGTNGGVVKININNYSNTTTYKTVLSGGGNAGAYVAYCAGLWRSTSAITSVTITPESGTISAGSTFDLYAISPAAANTAQASGGTDVYYDSSYVYHVFKASGKFTPTRNLTADVLVIAGGGGGGKDKGGGGGAGGVCYQASRSLSATPYTVTVGAGGSGSTGYTTANPTGGSGGSNGSNSVFDTIISVGGGLGATDNTTNYRNGASGGSGGGATRDGTIGSATQGNSGGATGYGNNGGSGNNGTGSIYAGGGGGGAGAVGANAPTSGTVMASGGAGLNTWSSWLSVTGQGVNGYIAGGGGAGGYGGSPLTGGTGGSGGGGNAGGYNPSTAGSNAVTNTGSGGGGGGDASNGGNGGSGIVIVRYAR